MLLFGTFFENVDENVAFLGERSPLSLVYIGF